MLEDVSPRRRVDRGRQEISCRVTSNYSDWVCHVSDSDQDPRELLMGTCQTTTWAAQSLLESKTSGTAKQKARSLLLLRLPC